MSSILQQNVVLVLKKAGQATTTRTPEEVSPQLATGAATALDIDGQQKIRPVTWEEWITLPVREQDRAVQTIRGGIRVPTVIVLANYAKDVNAKKANRMPEEAGLKLLTTPRRPHEVPVTATLRNAHDIPEWGIFL